MNPLRGEGQVRALLRAQDASGFALGVAQAWPGPLKTVLQLILDCSHPACVAWGPALHFFYNDAFAQLLGKKHPAALARPLWQVLPELRQALEPEVAQTLQGKPCFRTKVAFRILREGYFEETWFNYSLLPILNDAGEVGGVFSNCLDVSQQVETERCHAFLLALTDRLRGLEQPDEITAAASEMLGRELGASRVFYCEVDALKRTFFVRADWIRNGLASVAGETQRLDDFGPQIIQALFDAKPVAISDIAQDPRTAPYAEAYRRVDLRAYLVIPLVRAHRLVRLLSVHSDTPRRWSGLDQRLAEQLIERTWAAVENAYAQIELRKAVDKLQQADAHKDEFLALLAHELRNPLAPIRSGAELLQRAPLDEERVRKTSAMMARQVERMTSLVDDLLDVSRIARGLIELEKKPADLGLIVKEAVEQLSPLIQSKNQHLALQLSAQDAAVMGDEKRLVQVCANLLNNAAKYTGQGGHIALQTQVRNGQVMLSVSDDGIGMVPELAGRVFDLFAQAERTSERSGGGLGLGLALVKNIVELHGGAVACASAGPGKGSTFSVTLPQLRSQNHCIQQAAPQADALAPAPDEPLREMSHSAEAAQQHYPAGAAARG